MISLIDEKEKIMAYPCNQKNHSSDQSAVPFQRTQVIDQINQFLSAHAFLNARRHHRRFSRFD